MKLMPFRKVRLPSKEVSERMRKARQGKFDLGDDGIDADGHYDETKDRRSIEDLLKHHPKQLEEYREMMRKYNEKDNDD